MTHENRPGLAADPASLAALSRRNFLMLGAAGLAATGLMPGFGPGAAQAAGGTMAMTINPEPNAMLSAFNTASPVAVISGKMTEGLLHYDFDLNAHGSAGRGLGDVRGRSDHHLPAAPGGEMARWRGFHLGRCGLFDHGNPETAPPARARASSPR